MSDEPTEPSPSSEMLRGLDLKALLSSGLGVGTDDAPPEIPGYEVIERIGRGGMGSVYLAEQLSLSRLVAVKVIAMKPSATADQRELLLSRLESEALIMAKLNHPNLVEVYDFIKLANGDAAIVMERVAGGSIRDPLKTPEPVPVEIIIAVGRQVASCLAAAHAAGVIHRDIKPENLLVADDGTVKVSDFGLALDAESLRMTASGLSVGTLGYSAPEQLEGADTDERSDIYSLGVVLYELLTGLKPMGDVQRPSASRSDVPSWLERTILDALQSDPQRRIASAAEFQTRLAGGSAGSSRRDWLVATTALGIGSVAAAGWWYQSRPTAPAETPVLTPVPIRLTPVRGRWEKLDHGYRCGYGIALLGVTDTATVIDQTVRVEFTRVEGIAPMALLIRHPNGYVSAVIDAYRKGLGGVELIDGVTLETSGNTFEFRLRNGQRYVWELRIERDRIITHLDGVFMHEQPITTETLSVAEDWRMGTAEQSANSIIIGSYSSVVVIHGVEIGSAE